MPVNIVSCTFEDKKNRWSVQWRSLVDGTSTRFKLSVSCAALGGCKDAGERVARSLQAVVEKAPAKDNISVFRDARDRLMEAMHNQPHGAYAASVDPQGPARVDASLKRGAPAEQQPQHAAKKARGVGEMLR